MGCSSEMEFVSLNAQVSGELLALCALAPALESNLRAPIIPLLLCSEARPTGGYLAAMKIPPRLASELWRRRAEKGGRTRLATPFEAYRLDHSDDAGGLAASGLFEPKGSLPVYFVFLEVCSGPTTPVTPPRRLVRMAAGGHPCGEGVLLPRRPAVHDVQRGPQAAAALALVPVWRAERCQSPGGQPAVPAVPHVALETEPRRTRRGGSLEHPYGSSCAALPPMVGACRTWLFRHTLSMCEFGTSWRKDTDLCVVNAE